MKTLGDVFQSEPCRTLRWGFCLLAGFRNDPRAGGGFVLLLWLGQERTEDFTAPLGACFWTQNFSLNHLKEGASERFRDCGEANVERR